MPMPDTALSHFRPSHRPRRWLALFALFFLALAPWALAQEAAETSLEGLEAEFRVLPSSEGYILTPLDKEAKFDLVEVEADAVAVDGELRSPEQLQELLGDSAEAVLEMARRLATGEADEDLVELEARLREMRERENDQREEVRRLEEALEEVRERSRGRQRGVVRRDTRMSFGSSLTIEENESSRDVVVLGGALEVLGEIRGDAVVVGGGAEVHGQVSGDLTVIGGSVLLGPGSRVGGEVVSIGGPVERDPESTVRGEVTEMSMGPVLAFDDFHWGGDWLGFLWPGSWFRFGWNDTMDLVGNAVFLAIVMLLLVFVARPAVQKVANRADREPWKAALVGLLVQILYFPVVGLLFIVLLVSVVGIPLALLLLPMSLVVLVIFFLLGYAGVARVAGGWLEQRFDVRTAGPYLGILLGIILIQGWSILGEALTFAGGPIHFTAVVLILLGFLVKYIAWTTGLGAVVLNTFSPGVVSSEPPAPPPANLPPTPDAHRLWEDEPTSDPLRPDHWEKLTKEFPVEEKADSAESSDAEGEDAESPSDSEEASADEVAEESDEDEKTSK